MRKRARATGRVSSKRRSRTCSKDISNSNMEMETKVKASIRACQALNSSSTWEWKQEWGMSSGNSGRREEEAEEVMYQEGWPKKETGERRQEQGEKQNEEGGTGICIGLHQKWETHGWCKCSFTFPTTWSVHYSLLKGVSCLWVLLILSATTHGESRCLRRANGMGKALKDWRWKANSTEIIANRCHTWVVHIISSDQCTSAELGLSGLLSRCWLDSGYRWIP